jgi:O-antigen ligase
MDPSNTLDRTIQNVQLLAMFWLVWQLADRAARLEVLLLAYVAGGLVACFGTFYMYSEGVEYGWNRYAADGFDPNDLGIAMCLGVPMALWLYSRGSNVVARVGCLAYIIAGPVAILLTGSRAALITLAVALVMLPFALNAARGWWRAPLLLVVLGGVLVAGRVVTESLWGRYRTIGYEVANGGMNGRQFMWDAALDIANDHPILGTGAGTFVYAMGFHTSNPLAAHNTFISVFVELGFVGFLWFAALLISVAYGLWNNSRRGDLAFWFVLIGTWVAGANTLSWEMRKPTWLILALATAWAYVDRRTGVSPPQPASRRTAKSGIDSSSSFIPRQPQWGLRERQEHSVRGQ